MPTIDSSEAERYMVQYLSKSGGLIKGYFERVDFSALKDY
jgi:hypothetical protein